MANEYCKNCVYGMSKGGSSYYCERHKEWKDKFDTCNDFKWTSKFVAVSDPIFDMRKMIFMTRQLIRDKIVFVI